MTKQPVAIRLNDLKKSYGTNEVLKGVNLQVKRGIVDRFKSLPIRNLAVLNDHIISDARRNDPSTVIMLLTGLVMGFRSNASTDERLIIGLMLVVFTMAFSWISSIIEVIAKSPEVLQ